MKLEKTTSSTSTTLPSLFFFTTTSKQIFLSAMNERMNNDITNLLSLYPTKNNVM